jgi:hypothetical protein
MKLSSDTLSPIEVSGLTNGIPYVLTLQAMLPFARSPPVSSELVIPGTYLQPSQDITFSIFDCYQSNVSLFLYSYIL